MGSTTNIVLHHGYDLYDNIDKYSNLSLINLVKRGLGYGYKTLMMNSEVCLDNNI